MAVVALVVLVALVATGVLWHRTSRHAQRIPPRELDIVVETQVRLPAEIERTVAVPLERALRTNEPTCAHVSTVSIPSHVVVRCEIRDGIAVATARTRLQTFARSRLFANLAPSAVAADVRVPCALGGSTLTYVVLDPNVDVEALVHALSMVHGVESVSSCDGTSLQTRIEVDSGRLSADGLDITNLSRALTLRPDELRPREAAAFAMDTGAADRLDLGTLADGRSLQLRDIARVQLAHPSDGCHANLNGRPASALTICLEPGQDASAVRSRIGVGLAALGFPAAPQIEVRDVEPGIEIVHIPVPALNAEHRERWIAQLGEFVGRETRRDVLVTYGGHTQPIGEVLVRVLVTLPVIDPLSPLARADIRRQLDTNGFGPAGFGDPSCVLSLTGPEFDLLKRLADRAEATLDAIPGVDAAISSARSVEVRPHAELREAEIRRNGIDPRRVTNVLAALHGELAPATLSVGGPLRNARIAIVPEGDPSKANAIPVMPENSFAPVPLARLVDWTSRAEPDAIERDDGARAVRIRVWCDPSVADTLLDRVRSVAAAPAGYVWRRTF